MSFNPSIISWHIVIFDYCTLLIVLGLALSFDGSLDGLRLCSLILVAPGLHA
jgi:hypothetical protein